MSPEQEQARAAEAAHLLQHPMHVEAFTALESRLIDQLAVADISQERKDRLQALLASGRLYRRYLEVVIAGGAVAAATIEEEKKKATWRDRIRSAL